MTHSVVCRRMLLTTYINAAARSADCLIHSKTQLVERVVTIVKMNLLVLFLSALCVVVCGRGRYVCNNCDGVRNCGRFECMSRLFYCNCGDCSCFPPTHNRHKINQQEQNGKSPTLLSIVINHHRIIM